MSTTIVMPQLGESVTEGVIGKWLKSEGDAIARDEPLVEVTTDKVNAEIPSPVEGILQRIAQPEGSTVAVGQEIAVIGTAAGAIVGGPAAATTDAAVGAVQTRTGSAAPSALIEHATASHSEHSTGGHASSGNGNRGQRVRSSPLVRRLAEEHGIDLISVHGTGVGGRVSKSDILSVVQAGHVPVAGSTTGTLGAEPAPEYTSNVVPMTPPPVRPSAPSALPSLDDEIVRLTPIRRLIAERMALSTSTIPHATTIVEVDMSNVVRYREGKKDDFRQREGLPLSYVAFLIKATVESLKEYPDVNSEWAGDHILRKGAISTNVAVDAPDGLTTPVIHHADRQSLTGLCRALADLTLRARTNKLRMEDMQGGTFTVNNTGAIGSIWSLSIINPPQCGMLAAAAIVKRPVVIEAHGQDVIAVRSMMNLSFTFDHRILDGGYASAFLSGVKDRLEGWPNDYPLY